MKLQHEQLKLDIDLFHKKHGHADYVSLYGTGKIKNPKVMFLFMNPTAKNPSTHKTWEGIRAPWIGFKNTWKLMNQIGILNNDLFLKTQSMKSVEWTHDFAEQLYRAIAERGVYITNLAQCTKPDAQHVSDSVFREARELFLKEIELINPTIIIAFGNQVSSNLLQESIKVSECRCKKYDLKIGKKTFPVYPVFYPVGMGFRNIGKAVEDIKKIIKKNVK